MSKTFYQLDSTRVSFREYWWGTPALLFPLVVLVRLFRIPVPGSTDEPNVETLTPFEVDEAGVPEDIREQFRPLLDELKGLGFYAPLYHAITVPFTNTTIYWATLCHSSGRACARIHYRYWKQPRRPRKYLFPVFLTGFQDGGYLISSAGKPDMLSPANCPAHYLTGASATEVWQAHEMALEDQRDRSVRRVTNQEETRAFVEDLHAAVRDFHIGRGVFVPLPDTTWEVCASADDTTPAMEIPPAYADVFAELRRLENRKSSWMGAALMLLLSLAAFVLAAQMHWDWKSTLLIIPILFFHELGHLVAMRWFGYRNTRMFFIPFLGAAVTGRNYNVPGWKKVVVSLMGPVPGILVGSALGIAGWWTRHPSLVHAAFMAIFLNAFNLLPVLPLDGGWVLHATLFCRHRFLDVFFRILAVAAILGLAIVIQDRILMYVAIPMAIGLPTAYRTAKIADRLRAAGFSSASPDGQTIPTAAAVDIIREVKQTFPSALSARTAATITLNVFQILNARPPGWVATLGLWGVHGFSVLVAVFFGILLIGAQRNDLGAMMRMAAQRPSTPYERGSVRVAFSARQSAQDRTGPHSTIVANLKDRAQAEMTYRDLAPHLPANARLTLFGQTLLVSLPAKEERERNRRFDELRKQTDRVGVDYAKHHVPCSLFCIAPNQAVAESIEQELQQYFSGQGLGAALIPPWSPEWQKSPAAAQWRQARKTYARLNERPAAFFDSPELKEVGQKLTQAFQRGNEAEQKQLMEEQRRLRQRAELRYFDMLRAEGPDNVDQKFIDLYVPWWKVSQEKEREQFKDPAKAKLPLPQAPKQLTERLGMLPGADKPPGNPADPIVYSGFAHRESLYLSIYFQSPQLDRDLPDLAEWLYQEGCFKMTYDCMLGRVEAPQDEDDAD